MLMEAASLSSSFFSFEILGSFQANSKELANSQSRICLALEISKEMASLVIKDCSGSESFRFLCRDPKSNQLQIVKELQGECGDGMFLASPKSQNEFELIFSETSGFLVEDEMPNGNKGNSVSESDPTGGNHEAGEEETSDGEKQEEEVPPSSGSYFLVISLEFEDSSQSFFVPFEQSPFFFSLKNMIGASIALCLFSVLVVCCLKWRSLRRGKLIKYSEAVQMKNDEITGISFDSPAKQSCHAVSMENFKKSENSPDILFKKRLKKKRSQSFDKKELHPLGHVEIVSIEPQSDDKNNQISISDRTSEHNDGHTFSSLNVSRETPGEGHHGISNGVFTFEQRSKEPEDKEAQEEEN